MAITTYGQMRQDEADTLATLANRLVTARETWWDDAPWNSALDAHIAFWGDVEATCGRDGGDFSQDLKLNLVELSGQVISLCMALKTERDLDACDAVLRIDVEVAEGLLALSNATGEQAQV